MILAIVFIVAQAIEFALFLQAPHLESNPFMASMPVSVVAFEKILVVGAALLAALLLRQRGYPRTAQVVLVVMTIVAAFGAFTEVRVLYA